MWYNTGMRGEGAWTGRRNLSKKDWYKSTFDRCMNPDCQHLPYRLELHHLVSLKSGGLDDYKNYIILCHDCHQHSKLHGYIFEGRLLELFTYKFFMEMHVVGVASDDEQFEEMLKAHKKQPS